MQSGKESLPCRLPAIIINVLNPEFWGMLLDLCDKLSGKEGGVWAAELGNNFLNKKACWVAVQEDKKKILEVLGIITLHASTTVTTTVRQAFAVNKADDANPRVSYSESFLNDFGDVAIGPCAEQSLQYAKLLRNATEEEIFAGLKETTPSDLLALLKMQGKGQKCALLNNGNWNLFRMRNNSGELRTVDVRWRDDGWDVRSDSVGVTDVWREDHQVFSRN